MRGGPSRCLVEPDYPVGLSGNSIVPPEMMSHCCAGELLGGPKPRAESARSAMLKPGLTILVRLGKLGKFHRWVEMPVGWHAGVRSVPAETLIVRHRERDMSAIVPLSR